MGEEIWRRRRWGKSLLKTSSFLAAGATELEGVNQWLGAQQDSAQTKKKKRKMRSGMTGKMEDRDMIPTTRP